MSNIETIRKTANHAANREDSVTSYEPDTIVDPDQAVGEAADKWAGGRTRSIHGFPEWVLADFAQEERMSQETGVVEFSRLVPKQSTVRQLLEDTKTLISGFEPIEPTSDNGLVVKSILDDLSNLDTSLYAIDEYASNSLRFYVASEACRSAANAARHIKRATDMAANMRPGGDTTGLDNWISRIDSMVNQANIWNEVGNKFIEAGPYARLKESCESVLNTEAKRETAKVIGAVKNARDGGAHAQSGAMAVLNALRAGKRSA